ncbi:MAG: hypothetical protein EZS28_044563 [Streblomastix strix]|uniref:Uncharacterized protein n=1 Tax=Streblomastix strix TaxID=222440 RepID=A0A5J4TPK9_9EUKA|nr:MAG: hypothetical protein EZS28_044563 [Streblomastix strix]
MNPATTSLLFSQTGMFDPFERFAQASRLSVNQRQKGPMPSHTSPSNQFLCSSERFRSLGLGIGVGRQFLGGQKKLLPSLFGYSSYNPGNITLGFFFLLRKLVSLFRGTFRLRPLVLHIVVASVILNLDLFPCILVDLRERLLLIQIMSLLMRVMLSVVMGVEKKICEVYCALGLCDLDLCLGLLRYSGQIV